MNKFICVALFALVAVAAAYEEPNDMDSQAAALVPNDQEEIANLPESQKMFESFCLTSRDWVSSQVRQTSNSIASSLFKQLFNSAEALGQETVSTIGQATSRFGASLQNPEAVIEPADNQVQEILAEAQQKIRDGETQPRAFLTGFQATLRAVSKNVADFVGAKIATLSRNANPENVWNGVVEVCHLAETYEYQLKNDFKQAKAEFPGTAAIKFEDLACATTRRVSRLDGLCKFVAAARPALPKLFVRAPKAAVAQE